jgi:hypothetical protein
VRAVTLAPLVVGVQLLVSAAHAEEPGWKRYFDVKRVGTELAIKNKVLLGLERDNLFVGTRWSSGDVFGTDLFSAPRDALLLDVVGVIVTWRETLSISKIPKKDWERQLGQIEKRWVSEILHNTLDADAWNRDVDRESKRLAKAFGLHNYSGGGAGGYVDVKFRTEPKSGQVSIISEFDYELCKLSDTQNNHKLCTAWRVAKEPESVSGVYYIQVNWPGRVEGPNRYDLNPWSGKVHDIYWLRFPS